MSVFTVFRRQVAYAGFSPVYLAQLRDYNERYSIHAQNATRWRWIAFGCIGVTLVAVGGLAYDASLNKYTPYVVEVDHLGEELAIGRAQRADTPDLRILQAEIRNWIHNVRVVSTDAQTQKDMIWAAYDHTNKSGPAKGELDAWFKTNSPFERAPTEIVTITITRALPVNPPNWKTWRANWKEETRRRTGELISETLKEASITVSYKPATTDKEFEKNISGMFVDSFDWKN